MLMILLDTQEWDEHKKECRWKPMKKPDCHGKKKAYCAKNDKKFTEYGK